MKRKQSLAVCLIVKNEEHCLADCLESIKNIAQQVIIVDTGSTDNTLEIAKRYMAQIEYFTWQDDFAAARNFALSFAEMDWILVLDADERLELNNVCLESLFERDYEGYYLKIESSLGMKSLKAEDYVVRLFRNKLEYKFSGVIHEQIAGTIKTLQGENALGHSDLVIKHLGYLPEEIIRKKKIDRNSLIIKKYLYEEKEDPFLLYSLGTEWMQARRYLEARDVFVRALARMSGNEGYFRELVLLALMASYKSGKSIEDKTLYQNALKTMPLDSDILFLTSLRQIAKSNYMLAWEMLAEGGINTILVSPALIYTLAGEIFFRQKQWGEAVKYFKTSLEYEPSLYSAIRIIETIRQGELRAIADFAEALGPDFLGVANEAIANKDYYTAAVIYLAVINSDIYNNFNKVKNSYEEIIELAILPEVLKNYLFILWEQLEVCSRASLLDGGMNFSHIYLTKAIGKSLNVWLNFWPEHVNEVNIWECCL